MDFEKIREQEILDKLQRRNLAGPGGDSLQETRNVLNAIQDNTFKALTLLHQAKDPSALPRDTRMRFVKRVIQFLLRPYTRGQIEFNRISADILNALMGAMQETGRLIEDVNSRLSDLKAQEDKLAGDQVNFQRVQEDMKHSLAALHTSLSDLNKLMASSFQEMDKSLRNIHQRIEDEKTSHYKVIESVKKDFSARIEGEKASLHDRVSKMELDFHKRIEDEMSGSYQVIEKLNHQIEVERNQINDRLGGALRDMHKRIDDEKKGILDSLPSLGLLDTKIGEAKDHANRLADLVSGSLRGLEEKITPRAIFHLCQEHNSVSDEVYFMLEKNFRGTDEAVAERQNFYQTLLAEHHSRLAGAEGLYLDVGSGRGELLQLLGDHQIPAQGVDISPELVEYSRAKGLSVQQADANEYLKSLPQGSLRGVIALQLIEHMAIRELFDFITLAYARLKPGGIILLETINPESVYALRWFYMDYTHNRPLPAPLVQFFFLMAGFRDIEVFLRSPVEGWKQMAVTGDSEILDGNFHKLNNFLFGYQDYAIKGIK